MAKFPTKEADIAELAEFIYRGLIVNRAVFPDPPIPPALVRVSKLQYLGFHNQLIADRAAAETAIAAKDLALEDLIDAVRSDLSYAETTVNFDDAKLKLLGWSGRHQPRPLSPPGQPRQLEAPRQGPGTIFLDWKPGIKDSTCGKPAAYKVQRRRPAASTTGKWHDIATAIETEITLTSQPRGETLEYRIIAINKAGESPPGNTITATL